ncbi:hypothetical protein ACFR97_15180 [Haloplanus litoreus]|uniref:Uncharacterized protein n=1 Tax=Haloplanus litoreus TaxID=767515 RepID=A0ABD5ZW83_9EURY
MRPGRRPTNLDHCQSAFVPVDLTAAEERETARDRLDAFLGET